MSENFSGQVRHEAEPSNERKGIFGPDHSIVSRRTVLFGGLAAAVAAALPKDALAKERKESGERFAYEFGRLFSRAHSQTDEHPSLFYSPQPGKTVYPDLVGDANAIPGGAAVTVDEDDYIKALSGLKVEKQLKHPVILVNHTHPTRVVLPRMQIAIQGGMALFIQNATRYEADEFTKTKRFAAPPSGGDIELEQMDRFVAMAQKEMPPGPIKAQQAVVFSVADDGGLWIYKRSDTREAINKREVEQDAYNKLADLTMKLSKEDGETLLRMHDLLPIEAQRSTRGRSPESKLAEYRKEAEKSERDARYFLIDLGEDIQKYLMYGLGRNSAVPGPEAKNILEGIGRVDKNAQLAIEKRHAISRLHKAQSDATFNWSKLMMQTSAEKPWKDILASKQYKELLQAYRDMGIDMRFIPGEDVQKLGDMRKFIPAAWLSGPTR